MKVASTTDIPLFQSMVLTKRRRGRRLVRKKKVPFFSFFLTLLCFSFMEN